MIYKVIQSSAQCKVNYSPLMRQIFLSISSLAVGTGTVPGPVWAPGTIPSNHFGNFLPQPQVVLHKHMLTGTLLKTQGVPL